MDTGNPVAVGGGTSNATPGSDDGSRGMHDDGASFWNSNAEYLQSIAARFGGGSSQSAPTPQRQPSSAGDGDEYQEFARWKAAKEGKDPRAILELSGMQPADLLSATLFGGPPKEEPKPDPVESIRGELAKLKGDLEAERQQRQSESEKIAETRAKSKFVEQVGAMSDLTLLQKWGTEATDTSWNLYIKDVEEAFEAKRRGEQVAMPSLRGAAIRVENYLRAQAGKLSDVFGGGGAALEPLSLDSKTEAPNQAATAPTGNGNVRGMSPTLTNVGGETGARPTGPATPDELRARALAAAKALRGK